MDAHTIEVLLLGGAGLGVTVWVLHKVGTALLAVVEALAAVAVVFVALRWLIKALIWLVTQVVTRWRTSLTVLVVAAWWQWWGWPSLALTLGVIALMFGVWRWVDLVSFDYASSSPMWSRSTSSAATCAPQRWPAPTWSP